MWVHERKLSKMESVKWVKHFISDHARDAVKFYLDTNPSSHYFDLIDHFQCQFE